MSAKDQLAAAAGQSAQPDPDAPRRAIVFGAGGVLGFAWILGALSALQEVAEFDALEADVVIGTSAGSVVAGLLGCGIPADVIARHHQGVPAPDDPVIAWDYETGVGGEMPPRPGWRPGSPRMLVNRLRGRTRVPPIVALTGLLPTGRGSLESVRALVGEVAAEAGFAESWPTRPRPWIVTADYTTGQRVVFGRDDFVSRKGAPPRVVRRAKLADAVVASCSIPGWYPPTVIDGVPYIDGGASSNTSVDLLLNTAVEEVYVLAPMASVDVDRARTFVGRLERMVRRAITKSMLADVAKLRANGVRVYVVTPEPADLAAMGINLMNPEHRTDVLETAKRTAAGQLRRQPAGRRAAQRRTAGADGTGASSGAGMSSA